MADLLANTNFVGAIQNFVTRQICLDLSLSLSILTAIFQVDLG